MIDVEEKRHVFPRHFPTKCSISIARFLLLGLGFFFTIFNIGDRNV